MKHCKLCKQLLHYPEPPEVHVGMRFSNGGGKWTSSYTIFEIFQVKGNLHILARRDKITVEDYCGTNGEAIPNPEGGIRYYRFREGSWESVELNEETGNYKLQSKTRLYLNEVTNRDYS